MSESKGKTGTINDVLDILNRAQESFGYEIFIPSLQKNVMFRQINTNQQKRLLKSIIDNPAYNTEFIFTFKQIIEENCISKIDFNQLTIYDKLIIALTMRSMSIGDDYEVTFTTDNNQTANLVLSLKALCDKALSEINITSTTISDEQGKIQIKCDIPTIWEEYKLENELHKNVKTNIKTDSELRETLGEVFINEIVKYIRALEIKNEKDEIIEIDMQTMTFKERIKIIDNLGAKLTKEILKYMKTVNEEFAKVTIVKLDHNGKTYEERLKIDASFFTPS